MNKWESPLLGRQVEVTDNKTIWHEKPKHWWNTRKFHYEEIVIYKGEVVDRAESSAKYAIACEDGKIRWFWSHRLRLI